MIIIKVRPLGVLLIGYLYMLGAVMLLLSLFDTSIVNSIGIAAQFGLPYFPERLFRVLISFIILIMIYGYVNLRKWGYWFMILYILYFGGVSTLLSMKFNQQPFNGNMIWSILIFLYTFTKRKSFH
ncbi:hypothetical protein L7E55_17060 [Pelotomaculum isophthalicicum JI]|uniref:Uncharacterized protein n=1 Tax=Pelotomaculum isophthalicicum JI TaxID=947010 RepID=A0A9X4H0R5_9FIRM|nr:hypothetical protein [Pelotomaculum isophthalicicum]MDF9410027.1 hypothetical protein [Pelotomaculum isophthalicicum JI]